MLCYKPANPNHHNQPLWCVYGFECFPEMFCCKIIPDPESGPIILGYSVYQGVPGFRTLGRNIHSWQQELEEKFGYDLWEFYTTQEEALDRLRELTTPSPEAV